MITDHTHTNKGKRWVVKIGSSLLTDNGRGLDRGRIADWVAQIAQLRAQGYEMIVVSSGAVAEGMVRLGWDQRPAVLGRLQAAASVGQMGLVEAWERCFEAHDLRTAQVLLTHEEVANRQRYLNARNTLLTLLELGVVPIVNENDAVATQEIQLGDNDTLAALAVNLVEADLLVILTDQDGLYSADPRTQPDARRIDSRSANDPQLLEMAAGGSGVLGRGGMRTKVAAAVEAARSGAGTVIASGREADVLTRLAGGERPGTYLTPGERRLSARKRWLSGQQRVAGTVHVDAGAARALRQSGCSLLPVGITAIDGQFQRGDLVACVDPDGKELAHGVANYAAVEATKLIGQPSERIIELLGYAGEQELIHRDNLVLV